jgi:cyclopropane-fatty-acyl-phospholipid synthase
MSLLEFGIEIVERGWMPDSFTRLAIRRLCRQRLNMVDHRKGLTSAERDAELIEALGAGPIAVVPEKANQQHYELPPEFFGLMLGPHRKYSCCYFAGIQSSLAEAEEAALQATCDHAELADGQDILELGCGWGSLSLWMAQRYPRSRITAVSNSAPQRCHIEATAAQRGLGNLHVITADMNRFAPPRTRSGEGTFDRVVSVEMFEHMRNHSKLLARIAGWLRPAGKLLVHIFCHRELTYLFETEGAENWMGRLFFSGGIMPSVDWLRRFDRDLQVTRQWTWNGQHYQRTCEAWLAHLDARRPEVMQVLRRTYGSTCAHRWYHRWRTFLLSGAELFGFQRGQEWFVSHYLLERT